MLVQLLVFTGGYATFNLGLSGGDNKTRHVRQSLA